MQRLSGTALAVALLFGFTASSALAQTKCQQLRRSFHGIVQAGHTVNLECLDPGERQEVYGTTTNADIYGGTQVVYEGGRSENTTLHSGVQEIARGHSVGTVIKGGMQEVWVGGRAENTIIEGGTQKLRSGRTVVTGTIINGGQQIVDSFATARNTTINKGGTQNVVASGLAEGNTIISGGVQNVYNHIPRTTRNAHVSGNVTINNGGVQNIYDGGMSTATTLIGPNGTQNIRNGGTHTGATTIDGAGAVQNIHSGVTISSPVTIHQGTQRILTGGTAVGTRVLGEGSIQEIHNGGTARNTTVETGGAIEVPASASANMEGNNYIRHGGTLIAQAGSTVNLRDNSSLLIEHSGANSVTQTNRFSGTGTLNKAGTGTLVLTGASDHTGGTGVREGTLVLSGSGARISPQLVLHGGTTFRLENGATANLDRLDVRGNWSVSAPRTATWDGDLNMAGKNMNFWLPPDMRHGGQMLAVTGNATITNSTINVGIDGSVGSALRVGDVVTLINAQSLTASGNNANSNGMHGITMEYGFDIYEEGNRLLAKVTEAHINPQSTSLVAGFMPGAAFLTQGADLIAGEGINNARAVVESQGGAGAFGAVSGGRIRYNTGSHVDVHGLSLLTGLSWGKNMENDRSMLLGGFVEYGTGSYDTYNSFANSQTVNGDGDVYYFGVGALGRYELTSSVYTEGSFRLGNVRNKFHGSGYGFNGDMGANYKSSTMYYSAHLGAGHVWSTGKNDFDLYAKYLWTHQNSESVTLSTGDPMNFESVNSHRARAGVRFSRAVQDNVRLYVGAAYEYEFDGKANASSRHVDVMDPPSLKGSSGIADIGVTFNPSKSRPLSIDLGIQGYVGKREGVTGSLRVRYEF